jgi:hypothetical protein
MSEFVVIDLYSQWPAFERHVRGWPKQRVLQWLAQYGTIRRADDFSDTETEAYRFWSWLYCTRNSVTFRFDKTGRIDIIFPQPRPTEWVL